MISNEQRRLILKLYHREQYGYKKVARSLGLTRDQVRSVILTANRQGIKLQMAKFSPENDSVRNASSAYEDRDLSECTSDAEKIEYLQDENRLLRALLIEYQKEFLPEALNEFPAFMPNAEDTEQATAVESGKKNEA